MKHNDGSYHEQSHALQNQHHQSLREIMGPATLQRRWVLDSLDLFSFHELRALIGMQRIG